jgi:CBS domain-containing protein
VLAVGRNGGARIDSAMSFPAFVVSPDRLGGEVLYEMLERGIRHAPVVTERGQLIGVLEDADLYAAQPRSWFGARRTISRARNLNALTEIADRLPVLMLDLHNSSVPALELARVLSALVDALTSRALDLVSRAVGEPAEGLVWVTVGSQARRELTPATIGRGALVHAADGPPDPAWIAAAGPALAPSGVRAPILARDAAGWIDAGTRGPAGGDELALLVLADRRTLWGTPAEPLPLARGDQRARLLQALAAQAFTLSLPTGFDAGAVLGLDGRHTQLDLRRAAITPIATIARWAAAVADVGEDGDGRSAEALGAATIDGSTPDRLRAAAAAGVLETRQAQTLAEAFELSLELRIVHQMEQIAAGQAPDDLLDPGAMTPLSRGHLREVFRAVSAVVRQLRP